jgi:hypothetical protein
MGEMGSFQGHREAAEIAAEIVQIALGLDSSSKWKKN